jgi:hypothetical protein
MVDVRGWQSISCVAGKIFRAQLAKYFMCGWQNIPCAAGKVFRV